MALLDSLGIPSRFDSFDPTHNAAMQRLDAVVPSAYARSRNALDGTVTGLSPYFTHGLLSISGAACLVAPKKSRFDFAGHARRAHLVWAVRG